MYVCMYEGDEHGHMALQLPDRAVSGYDVFLFEQVIERAWYVCMYVSDSLCMWQQTRLTMYVIYIFISISVCMHVCMHVCN